MNIKSKLQYFISLLKKSANASLDSEYKLKRALLEQQILHSTEKGITEYKYCEHKIIVSLTTYGKRINDAAITIESIMEQTMKANRIILWLEDSFKTRHLPVSLQILQKRGLEIKYCPDIKSYKKLIPALKEYPEDVIITVDDDLIYDYDLLEHLIVAYLQNPQNIYCHRMHKIKLDKSNKYILPYFKWEWESEDLEASNLVFPTGGGGILYPPHCFDEEVTNEKVFLDICKYADDIWFKAMALKKGTKAQRVFSRKPNSYIINESVQDVGLITINGNNNMNDIQLKAVFSRYDLYDKIIHEVKNRDKTC